MLVRRLSVLFCIRCDVLPSRTGSFEFWISMVDGVKEELTRYSIVVFV